MPERRLVIVSNRLPFTLTQDREQPHFTPSVGGLATGLRAFLEHLSAINLPVKDYLWVGWPGSTIPDEQKQQITERMKSEYRSSPVFLTEQEVEQFYQGFCNSTIWPLFHYFATYAQYNATHWQQYVNVNQSFCDAIVPLIQPNDVLWIHDYHLMLLPNMIRQRVPDAVIGFFLHIPFPAYEIFGLMPRSWRRQIIEGLLGADLIGFHTYDYMQDFLRCSLRVLGLEHNIGQIIMGDRVVKTGCFPMGIDFDSFQSMANSPIVKRERDELDRTFGSLKIILSVDRLDYTKGIINRLEGFELMLEQHPEWRQKTTMVMVVVPSRIGVSDYERMKKQIEESVGKINGKFGTIGWSPIIYQFKSLNEHQLIALYAMSHVGLVTPLRDGMNLIAKEFIASKVDKSGVLILSEMAGAAKEMGEAVIINPTTREEIADALIEALTMPWEEQGRRNVIMQHRLKRYNVIRWASDFIGELIEANETQQNYFAKLLTRTDRQKIIDRYQRGSRRLLLLDYDGTLMPFFKQPQLAVPSKEVLEILQQLSSCPQNELILISGRDKQTLQQWFGSLPIGLAAEHGAWIRQNHSDWRTIKPLASEWKSKIFPVLDVFADRLPGAFVEEKEFSLVWHYRAADQEQGKYTSMELMDELLRFTGNIDVQVLQGKKTIEVRTAGINKGIAAGEWLKSNDHDFILAIGDDWTDEDLFSSLPESAVSIRVGLDHTRARFHVKSPSDVLNLLRQLR